MDQPAAPVHQFDPVRHDSLLIALFDDAASAEGARAAVVAAGVPADHAAIMADGAALHEGSRHPVQDLFVPEDDYEDYHHALGRGNALLTVRPASPEMREAAIRALESVAPLDLEQHGRRWRGSAAPEAPEARMAINHANLSRADMVGRAIGGRDEVILDMTGQKMTVRMLSETDMVAAPFAPALHPDHRPAPLAPPPPVRDVPVSGTNYTYGVPSEIVKRMSPEEQVRAQPNAADTPGHQTARDTFLRVVNGHTRVGWRDTLPTAPRIRSYVTER